MATAPATADARQSLTDHAAARGREVFLKYGPQIGWAELQRLLLDRAYVRYPCAIVFDAGPLQAGELAHAVPLGPLPEEGFTLYVHPVFRADLARVPPLVLYQLVAVNYGDFASSDDAESFGAAALGLTCDEYYAIVCARAEQLPVDDGADAPTGGGGDAGGCG